MEMFWAWAEYQGWRNAMENVTIRYVVEYSVLVCASLYCCTRILTPAQSRANRVCEAKST